MKKKQILFLLISTILLIPNICLAHGDAPIEPFVMNVSSTKLALTALVIFSLAYLFVISEEFIELRKSKPIVFASGIIWIIVALIAKQKGLGHLANAAIKYNILEYGELFLFLLVAMTYVNAMEERKVFDSLRCWMISKKFTFKSLYWVTGILSFFISPIADNLTTSLLMCSVLVAVGKNNKKFVTIGCVNIVVAANAGGAFSPFGDLTTLMVWQQGILPFIKFFKIFIPASVSYIVPAFVMSIAIPKETPQVKNEHIKTSVGAKRIVALFILTIITAICFHSFLHLPPAAGMMTGLAYLKLFGFYLRRQYTKKLKLGSDEMHNLVPFDIIKKIERIEWDTLLFFYGVMLCIGGLATLGYLEILSDAIYNDLNFGLHPMHQHSPANIIMGVISAIVDNIPVMFSILSMKPQMSEGQWLLITLTTGIGGSLLSVGSAAGVALMGQAKGLYTFFGHLKWTWIIFVGYVLGVITHIWVNNATFYVNL